MSGCVGKTIRAKVTEIEWCTVEEEYGRISMTIIRVGQDKSPDVELRLPYTRFPVSYLGPQDHEGDHEIIQEQVAPQRMYCCSDGVSSEGWHQPTARSG